jgi:hypothetical protein
VHEGSPADRQVSARHWKAPYYQSGTQEAQLLPSTILQAGEEGKVTERRTLNIAPELKSNDEIKYLTSLVEL